MKHQICVTVDKDEEAKFRLFLSRQNTKRLQSGAKTLNFSQGVEKALAFSRRNNGLLEN